MNINQIFETPLVKLAKTISIIFHPMVFSLFVFTLIIFDNNENHPDSFSILTTCFIFSNVLPILTLFYLQKRGVISDLDASIREERIMPLFLGVFFATIGYAILHIQEAGLLVKGLMFCSITNTLVIILITQYWKISIHTMGMSGLLSVLWIHNNEYLFIMLIILLLVAYSRVVLRAHDILQVSVGSLLGLFLTLIQIHFLFQNI